MRNDRKIGIDRHKRALYKAKENYLRTGDIESGMEIEIYSTSCCNQYETTATSFRSKREHFNKYGKEM